MEDPETGVGIHGPRILSLEIRFSVHLVRFVRTCPSPMSAFRIFVIILFSQRAVCSCDIEIRYVRNIQCQYVDFHRTSFFISFTRSVRTLVFLKSKESCPDRPFTNEASKLATKTTPITSISTKTTNKRLPSKLKVKECHLLYPSLTTTKETLKNSVGVFFHRTRSTKARAST